MLLGWGTTPSPQRNLWTDLSHVHKHRGRGRPGQEHLALGQGQGGQLAGRIVRPVQAAPVPVLVPAVVVGRVRPAALAAAATTAVVAVLAPAEWVPRLVAVSAAVPVVAVVAAVAVAPDNVVVLRVRSAVPAVRLGEAANPSGRNVRNTTRCRPR